MIIVISWSSFWIDPKGPSSAARFMIVTICLLYASYDASKLNSKLPKVAYTKMIDVWTGVRKWIILANIVKIDVEKIDYPHYFHLSAVQPKLFQICVTILFFTFKHSVLIHYFTRFDNCGESKEHGKFFFEIPLLNTKNIEIQWNQLKVNLIKNKNNYR